MQTEQQKKESQKVWLKIGSALLAVSIIMNIHFSCNKEKVTKEMNSLNVSHDKAKKYTNKEGREVTEKTTISVDFSTMLLSKDKEIEALKKQITKFTSSATVFDNNVAFVVKGKTEIDTIKSDSIRCPETSYSYTYLDTVRNAGVLDTMTYVSAKLNKDSSVIGVLVKDSVSVIQEWSKWKPFKARVLTTKITHQNKAVVTNNLQSYSKPEKKSKHVQGIVEGIIAALTTIGILSALR